MFKHFTFLSILNQLYCSNVMRINYNILLCAFNRYKLRKCNWSRFDVSQDHKCRETRISFYILMRRDMDDSMARPLPCSLRSVLRPRRDSRWRGHIDFKPRANGQPANPATNLLSLVGVGNHPASQSANQPANLPTCQLTIHPTTATTYPPPPILPPASSRTSRSLHDPLWFMVPGSWSCVRLTRFQWIQCRGRSYRIWKREINECFFSRSAARRHRSESGIPVDSALWIK